MTLSGLLVGGAVPAVCLGLGTAFMRASLGAGASIPLYLAVVGSVVALLGWAAFIWTGAPILFVHPVLLAAAMGTTWTLAIGICSSWSVGQLNRL